MTEISRHQKKPAGIAKGAGTVRNPMESETPLLPMQPKIMEKTAAVAGSKIVRSVNACAILRRSLTPGKVSKQSPNIAVIFNEGRVRSVHERCKHAQPLACQSGPPSHN